MNVIHYQPWALRREFFKEFNKALEGAAQDTSSATAGWAPAVDIEEYADRFVLTADVPGVDPQSIEVTLEKGVLTLAGNREPAVEQAGVERRRSERASGRFSRRFSLPDTVDSEAVSASNRNGVLQVTIPKRPQVQPRRITVSH